MRLFTWCAIWLACVACTATAQPTDPAPRVFDDRLELTLVARELEIVTPIGLTFDRHGRLLVIESHTHFPPEGYAGPKTDRIRLLEDTDGDGRADRFRSFHEGSEKTMSIRRGPDDWIYVATRLRVFRLRDTNGDDVADQEEEIARLDTPGDYPHDGLCGLAFDDQGGLYFGLGENLGEPYTLIGSDGTRLSGGGEGGNVYHCQLDGSSLRQVATGFWNPFGICLDPHGRLFCIENDPDASPPCRLLHVVEGGDYGYQFRYGRSGKHPLQAWDGELPGTLPMVAGTSEGPSAVVPYHGQLYVSSWGEYRVERFRLEPRGASFSAVREVVVEGDDQFRPIDFAVAPDGSLYFTDWVDRSYEVHGKGRIWRLKWKGTPPTDEFPALTAAEQEAARLASSPNQATLSLEDPFLHQAAVVGLTNSTFVESAKLSDLADARQTLGLLEAARRSKIGDARRDELLAAALSAPHSDVRLYAVRWISDARLPRFRANLAAMLNEPDVPWPLFRATLAAIDWIDTGTTPAQSGRAAGEPFLLAVLQDNDRPTALRAMALRMLGPSHPAIAISQLNELLASSDAGLRREAVRTLVRSPLAERSDALEAVIADTSADPQLRADAVAGLLVDETSRPLLEKLAAGEPGAVQAAAARQLARSAPSGTTAKSTFPATSPGTNDIDAWLALVGEGGDRDAGWRAFFGQGAGRCGDCHTVAGQGADVGPDLSGIATRMGRRRVLESILEPSREIAPRYVPWTIETTDGRTFTALSLGVPGSGPVEQLLLADGKQIDLPRDQVAARAIASKSVMPDGLHEQFSPAELRDILALLGEE
ncbi:MAG: HEAT repeat domain-containing protein [Pirellulales bacterium]|nr:HEAT repeat domain-containing protein [Pirellulales bacterium]